jgi:hypothetical protein
MASDSKPIKLDSPEAEKLLSELFGVMVTFGSSAGKEMLQNGNTDEQA